VLCCTYKKQTAYYLLQRLVIRKLIGVCFLLLEVLTHWTKFVLSYVYERVVKSWDSYNAPLPYSFNSLYSPNKYCIVLPFYNILRYLYLCALLIISFPLPWIPLSIYEFKLSTSMVERGAATFFVPPHCFVNNML
jgi:hypothetical protein